MKAWTDLRPQKSIGLSAPNAHSLRSRIVLCYRLYPRCSPPEHPRRGTPPQSGWRWRHCILWSPSKQVQRPLRLKRHPVAPPPWSFCWGKFRIAPRPAGVCIAWLSSYMLVMCPFEPWSSDGLSSNVPRILRHRHRFHSGLLEGRGSARRIRCSSFRQGLLHSPTVLAELLRRRLQTTSMELIAPNLQTPLQLPVIIAHSYQCSCVLHRPMEGWLIRVYLVGERRFWAQKWDLRGLHRVFMLAQLNSDRPAKAFSSTGFLLLCLFCNFTSREHSVILLSSPDFRQTSQTRRTETPQHRWDRIESSDICYLQLIFILMRCLARSISRQWKERYCNACAWEKEFQLPYRAHAPHSLNA